MNLLILGLPFLLGGFSANTYQAINEDVNHVEVDNQLQPKLVSYDDTNFEIALNQNELSYSFENLAIYLRDNGNDFLQNVIITFNHTDYTLSDVSDGEIYFDKTIDNVTYQVFLIYDNVFVNEQNDSNVDNYKFYDDMNELITLDNDSSFVIECENSTIYAFIKTAIEQDIQANTQPYLQPVLTELVGLLVGGITGIATGIGSGVSDLVSNIFLNNGSLSTFGAIIAVFGGIALAIGLSRWIMNFLTSLGAKK